jgi:hypothetical protein
MMQTDSLEMRKTVTNLMVRWKTTMVDGAERIVPNSGGWLRKGTAIFSQLRASLLDYSCLGNHLDQAVLPVLLLGLGVL